MMITQRPRRNRRTAAIRGLVKETDLSSSHLVLPLFVVDGEGINIPINGIIRSFIIPMCSMLTLVGV